MQTIVYIGNKLSAKGYTPTTIDTLVPCLETLGVKVIVASDKLNKLWRLKHMLLTIAKHRHANCVIIDTYSTSAFYFAYTCSRLCRLLHIPYIPVLHGGNLPYRFSQSPRLTRSVFGNSFMNIAVSPYLEALLIKYKYKHTLVENHIDIAKYPFRQRGNVSPGFIWVRSFDEIYNPEMAIHVFKSICQQYPGATLTMVGPDKDGSLASCMTLAKSFGLEDAIRFTGKLSKDEWVSIAAKQDIFINTSSYDNLPVSIIEAMALGLIIISTDAGGLPYLLQHGFNALLSGIDDVPAMTDNVLSVLSHNADVQKLSKTARNTAEKYDWEQVKYKWKNLFDTLQHG